MRDPHADDLQADDTAARRRAWIALSALYLDTEVDGEHAHVARTLAATPFSLGALRAMLFEDVHPALRANLWSAAGVWTAFDVDWLVARIERRRARPRWLRGVSCVFCGYPRAHWQALRPMIVAARAVDATPLSAQPA